MLHVALLGQQVIADEEGGHRPCSSRGLALAAYLVAHAGAVVPRRRLAALFWPDSTDAQALTNLRRELHHLRHAVGQAPVLGAETAGLAWRDVAEVTVDLRVFDRAARDAVDAAAREDTAAVVSHGGAALAQYRGAFLPEVDDEWAVRVREDRETCCARVCSLLAEALARTGDPGAAEDVARRRVRLRPLEEAGYRALMRLQLEQADHAGAVSAYERCASVLGRELGVTPGAETRRLLDTPSLHGTASGAGPPDAAGGAPAAPGRAHGTRNALVGREAELAALGRAWRRALAGGPGLVLVRGEAGVGKTRLVGEFAAVVRDGDGLVAESGCYGTSDRLALAPVADWLRVPALRASIEGLDPVWRLEVERLVPRDERPDDRLLDGSRAMVDAWRRHRFVEGLARAFLQVGRPLLLVLENLHWGDQETLDFLSHLLGRAGDAPLLIVGTARDGPGAVDEWFPRVRATGAASELPLDPLSVEGTARLATVVTGRPPDDAAALHAVTGGLPLHVVEALSAGAADTAGPARGDLAAMLRARFDEVGPTAREVAALAAAVGREFSLALLVEASELDADAVVRALDELWRRRIVRETGPGYDFSHELLREAADALASPPTRWLLHRRLAGALEELHADGLDAVSARLARHHALGGRPERAVAAYRRAADVAASRFAHGEAIRLLREALGLVRALPPGQHRDEEELAVRNALAAPLNARHGYASAAVRETLEASVALAHRIGRRDAELSALVGLWTARFVGGAVIEADAIAARALAMVDAAPALAVPAHFAAGGSALGLGRLREGLRHFAVVAEAGDTVSLSVGSRPDVHGAGWSAHAHWLLGDDDRARETAAGAVAAARRIEHPYSLAIALAYEAVTHQLRDDRASVEASVAELTELCERYGFAYYREWAPLLTGWARGGRAGAESARRGIDGLRATGAFFRMPYWLTLVADIALRRGRPDEARAVLDAAIADARSRGDVWWLPEVLRRRAAFDEDPAALERLAVAADLAREHGSTALLRRCRGDLGARGVAPDGHVPASATGDGELPGARRHAERSPAGRRGG
ncbi:ATP-binding protein [Actinomycetospora cinnamomea]|uniref:Adenylate/guanylate cyclase n=1 Tax=Actinomycetospora cinnamomea TaxID=663609 RepID=A0A2U1FG69_9PSEU|nr:AAA family ATPase [Actinomycetospora cinnamomea]PVZ11147.1 adenylate/guanylate cyclase [Actinomycetospora cinnamomea]